MKRAAWGLWAQCGLRAGQRLGTAGGCSLLGGLLGIIGATTERTNQASSLRATSICPAKATLRVPAGHSDLGWSQSGIPPQSPVVLIWGDGALVLKDFLLMSPKAYQVRRLAPSFQNSKKDDLVSFPVCIEIWWGLGDVSSHLPSGLLYILSCPP